MSCCNSFDLNEKFNWCVLNWIYWWRWRHKHILALVCSLTVSFTYYIVMRSSPDARVCWLIFFENKNRLSLSGANCIETNNRFKYNCTPYYDSTLFSELVQLVFKSFILWSMHSSQLFLNTMLCYFPLGLFITSLSKSL